MLADILLQIGAAEHNDDYEYFPRPSSGGLQKCIRQSVFHSMGIPPDLATNDRMFMVFDDGHWHEELTNDWIRKSTYTLHSEQMPIDVMKIPFIKAGKTRWCRHCNKEVPTDILHGHIDGIITDFLGNDCVFDHKAINHFTFVSFLEGKDLPLDYFTQLAQYTYGLQKTANVDLKQWLLLIKNKNTAQYMEFFGTYDSKTDILHVDFRLGSEGTFANINYTMKDIIKNTMDRFIEIDEWTKKNTLPKRQYYIDGWRCSYCRWNISCYKGYTEEQQKKVAKFPKDMEPERVTDEKKLLTKNLLKNIFVLKKATKPGDKAIDIIKNYMRINNLLHATFEQYVVRRSLTAKGDRFSFKEIYKNETK